MIQILVVDDSRSVHAYLESISKDHSIKFTHAYNGSEGIEAYQTSPNSPFDLVLLDWEMPVVSGPEVLAEAKKGGWSVPIMMLTSKNKPEEIAEMLELGAQEYIMKPFTPDILFSKIEMVIGVPLGEVTE